MAGASARAGVGPMAAVAGAIAEQVGRGLLGQVHEVIVENGGDIFLKILRPRRAAIFAGASSLSERVQLQVAPDGRCWGLCTSSGTVWAVVELRARRCCSGAVEKRGVGGCRGHGPRQQGAG